MLTLWGVGHQPAVAEESPRIRCAGSAQETGSGQARSDTATAKQDEGQVSGTPQGSPGMRVYVDPETGEFTVPPKEARAVEAPAPEAAFSSSHEGLVEVRSSVPGGGILLDLQGRFRSPLTATLGTDGKLKMQHGPCAPTSDGRE
jgi:hypothetical protein